MNNNKSLIPSFITDIFGSDRPISTLLPSSLYLLYLLFIPLIHDLKYKRKYSPFYNNMYHKDIILPFHQWISTLDYFTDLDDRNLDAKMLLQTDNVLHRLSSEVLEAVPLRFSSQEHYQQLWLKLFQDEVKAQIIRSKVQQSKQPQSFEILEVNDLNDWFKLITLKKNAHSVNVYSSGALVVLSPIKPSKKQRYPCIVGFIDSIQPLKVKAPLNQTIKQKNQEEWELMIKTKNWFIQEICSISTLQREYFALHSLSLITPHLRQIIIHPDQHNKQFEKRFKIPEELDTQLKSLYNQSQYKAINQCLKQTGITMIQGPPGTGKTKTVLGTLSILLSSYRNKQEEQEEPLMLTWKKSEQIIQQSKLLNPWLYSDYKDWRDEPLISNQDDFLGLSKFYVNCSQTDKEIELIKKTQGVQLPGKVMICGPSNASVDEIIRKLVKQNLLDKHGEKYLPSFVRIGQNYDPVLKQYSLDFLADKLSEKERGTDILEYRNRILSEYRLVFGTLSSVGSNTIKNSNVKFDTVIIDEAGQSIQISNLIPLVYNCQRLILIGDPNQLPATVFSSKSLQHRYDQSLFQRLMRSGFPVSILKTQYRMHPEISQVIGKNFYGEKLQNWSGIMAQEPISVPKSFMIFHVEDSHEIPYKKSFKNPVEAKIVKDIAAFLYKHYQDIGIISPYSQQIALIQSMVGKKKMEVKTIDSFQGREKQVILFSSVRSRFMLRNKKVEENKRKTIGFVSDLRRINVSLSRAKNVCIIVGDIKRLSLSPTWETIIRDSIKRGQVFNYSSKKNYLSNLNKQFKESMVTQL